MISNKLANLRKLFTEYDISGYIISTRDEFLSEYPPEHAKRLEYLTGFTGSNGVAVILEDTVLFFTDGRYLTQCETQLDSKLFQVFDQKFIKDCFWNNHIKNCYESYDKRSIQHSKIGYDPKIFTDNALAPFKKLNLKPVQPNLIDKIWPDQPPIPQSTIYNYDIKFTGLTTEEKLAKCRKFLSEHKAEYLLITDPYAVCWLFNIRASDVKFSPLLLAYSLITKDEAFLFTSGGRKLPQDIKILPPEILTEKINYANGVILFDDNLCSKYLSDIIKQKPHKIIQDPCQSWKACKNEVEIKGMIEGHIQDAIAMCEFLAFLANNDLNNYSEYDLSLILTEFRSKGKNYVCDSFPAIIGFQDNGAIIHYRPLADKAKKIQGDGLLLIDSGGQYLGATTDITRVVSINFPKAEYKKYYTKILKGHLALSMARFPKDAVTGANLDILARQFLWQDGDDYAHGTGHGVGSFLSVHEGPQNINLNSYQTKFASGMVVSNEPGFYKTKEFGIRIENLMYVKKYYPHPPETAHQTNALFLPERKVFSNAPHEMFNIQNNTNSYFLEFEQLTLVPYAKNLISWELLTASELAFLKKYYSFIEQKVSPALSSLAQIWLMDEISLIKNM